MNPLISAGLVDKIVTPCNIYGCELWNDNTKQSVEKLRKTQRYEARRCLRLDKQSSSLLTTQCLGMTDIWQEVERHKLCFFNKLCRANVTFTLHTLYMGSWYLACGDSDMTKEMLQFKYFNNSISTKSYTRHFMCSCDNKTLTNFRT